MTEPEPGRPGTATALGRVLVVGATGLVGSALVARLQRRHDCTALHVLGRREPATAGHGIVYRRVDFAVLEPAEVPAVDVVFCCLGSTLRAAGSREAFRQVDLDHVVRVARLARAQGADRLLVISALGADPRSRVFYNRVKGEMESAVAGLGYRSVTLLRPSLLAGDRAERRRAEQAGLVFARLLAPLIPRRYRAVPADAVALAMLHFAGLGQPGVQVVESDRLQDFSGGADAPPR